MLFPSRPVHLKNLFSNGWTHFLQAVQPPAHFTRQKALYAFFPALAKHLLQPVEISSFLAMHVVNLSSEN